MDDIAAAEIIDSMPFDSLDRVIALKRRMDRKKDLNDVDLIQEFLRANVSI